MNRGPVNKCVKSSGDFLLGSGLNSDCIFKLCPQIEVPGEVRIFEAAEPLFSHQQHLPDHGLGVGGLLESTDRIGS